MPRAGPGTASVADVTGELHGPGAGHHDGRPHQALRDGPRADRPHGRRRRGRDRPGRRQRRRQVDAHQDPARAARADRRARAACWATTSSTRARRSAGSSATCPSTTACRPTSARATSWSTWPGCPASAPRRRASASADVLRHVGLDEERYRPMGGYSTGMKQRAKLAQALAHDPRLVFLDEPTNGLDPAARNDMLRLVERIGSDFGIAVLVTSHLLGELEQVSDHVIVLDGGHLLRSSATGDFLQRTGSLLVEVVGTETERDRLGEALAQRGLVCRPARRDGRDRPATAGAGPRGRRPRPDPRRRRRARPGPDAAAARPPPPRGRLPGRRGPCLRPRAGRASSTTSATATTTACARAPPTIARTLFVTGLRHAYGLGRSGKSKVMPFLLLAMSVLPALIVVGVVVLTGLDSLPVSYADYTNQTQLLVSLFAAAQAPVLFSRDLRHRSIVLYLARPLSGAGLRADAVAVADGRAVALHGRADAAALRRARCCRASTRATRSPSCSRRSCSRPLLALLIAGITGLISSVSLRRGFAVVGSVMALIVLTGVVTAVQAIAQEQDADSVSTAAGLFSPWSLYTGLADAWDAGRRHLRARSTAPGPWPTSWSRCCSSPAACWGWSPASGRWGRDEQPGPRLGLALVRQRGRRQRRLADDRPRRHRPARPQRRRQDDADGDDGGLPRAVVGARHARRPAGVAQHRHLPADRAGARARAQLRLPHRAPVRPRQRRPAPPARRGRGHRADPRGGRHGRAGRGAASTPTPRACGSASRSPRPWCTTRRCCCSTSRSTASTRASGCT